MKNSEKYPDVTEWVVCAACKNKDTGLIICGPRHLDSTMRAVMDATGGSTSGRDCEQGFINQWGDFLTREEALVIVQKNGQKRRSCGGDTKRLYSENLY